MNPDLMGRVNLSLEKKYIKLLDKQRESEHRTKGGHIAWLLEKYEEITQCYYCSDRQDCKRIIKLIDKDK